MKGVITFSIVALILAKFRDILQVPTSKSISPRNGNLMNMGQTKVLRPQA